MNHKANILIVDDAEVVRLSYLRSLGSAGYRAESAGSGQEAILAMERNPADVVILDLRMPEMDGISVLKTIRQRWPESEVIIITGYPTIESAKEALKLGAFHYLVKPLGPDALVRATDDALVRKNWTLRAEWPLEAVNRYARQGGTS